MWWWSIDLYIYMHYTSVITIKQVFKYNQKSIIQINVLKIGAKIMNLHFEPVSPENRTKVEELQILPEQAGFIESVRECMAEADEFQEWNCLLYTSPGNYNMCIRK